MAAVKLIPFRTPLKHGSVRVTGTYVTSDGRFLIYGDDWWKNFNDSYHDGSWPVDRKPEQAARQRLWLIEANDSESCEEDRKLLASVGMISYEDGLGTQPFKTAREAFAALKQVAYPEQCDN